MGYRRILNGATSQLIEFPIFDSTSTTGALKTSLTYSSMTAYYYREGDSSSTSMSLVTMTMGTWTSLGFVAVDGTNMAGIYQLGIPNAALNKSGCTQVTIYLTASGCVPVVLVIELTSVSDYPANMTQILGTAVSTPATAGILDVNVKNIVNAAAALDGNNLLKVDLVDIAGSAVSASSAQLGVNVVNIAGQAAALDANNLLKVDCVDWAGGAIPSPNVTGVPKTDMVDILGTAVSSPATAGVLDVNIKNVGGSALSTSSAQLGVNAVNIGGSAAASATVGTVTNLTNAPTSGDLTATMKASVTAAVPSTASIAAALPSDSSIQTDCYNAMNTAYTDGTSLNSYGLLDRIRWLCWLTRNEIDITDSTGAGVLKNDSGTAVASSWSVTDNATTTVRTRVA
ncbi:MAG: hypothetical protein ACLQVJ_19215 [Syntrophobacteraceae bacterium]